MRLNRTHKRPLEFSRGPADRDPMFEPIWYDGIELKVTLTPPTAPVQEPGPTWDLAPLPPPDPRELKWKEVVEKANEVVAILGSDPDVDGAVLVDAVCSLVDINPSVDEIVEAYRRRMEAKHNG